MLYRCLFAFVLTCVLALFAIAAERAFDRTPRIATISAFLPELTTLLANVKGPKQHDAFAAKRACREFHTICNVLFRAFHIGEQGRQFGQKRQDD